MIHIVNLVPNMQPKVTFLDDSIKCIPQQQLINSYVVEFELCVTDVLEM